jgi:Rieske Fe-S protein
LLAAFTPSLAYVAGKHNIHFDFNDSDIHDAIQTALTEMNFATAMNCNLRETGITLTRPASETEPANGYEGEMEYHSDGAEGEYTVLFSMEKICSDMGCLKIIPSSHKEYVEGIGHAHVSSIRI